MSGSSSKTSQAQSEARVHHLGTILNLEAHGLQEPQTSMFSGTCASTANPHSRPLTRHLRFMSPILSHAKSTPC